MSKKQQTLVIIPAYNEQGAIAQVVTDVRRVLPNADILVIDDGSSDNTSAVAHTAGAYVIRHPVNLGIGGTIQTGLKFARRMKYNFVARLDGDGQHNPLDLLQLLNAVENGRADIAYGSRFVAGNDVDMHIPFTRKLGIKLFAAQVSLLTRQRVTDTTSGFMAMNRRAIQVLACYLPQDYPEVEGRIIIHKAGLASLELPTQMRERSIGISSINSWKSVYYAFKVSIAVMLTALKPIPPIVEETRHAHPHHSTSHRHRLQLGHVFVDHIFDPQAQAA